MNFRRRTDLGIVVASATLLFIDIESVKGVDEALSIYELHSYPK